MKVNYATLKVPHFRNKNLKNTTFAVMQIYQNFILNTVEITFNVHSTQGNPIRNTFTIHDT